MTTVAFDTLGYFEKLKDAGFTEKQARVQVEAMQGVVRSYDEASRKELATKGDIQDVRNEIQDVRNELKQDIQDVRTELANTKHEILKWMMTMMVAQTALIMAVLAFLK